MISKLNQWVKVQTAIWSSKQKLDILLFSLFIVFLPSQLGIHFWPNWSLLSGIRVDYFSPTLYLEDILLFLIAAWSLASIRVNLKLKTAALIVIAAFVLINVLFSLKIEVTLYKWARFFELGLISFWAFRNKDLIKTHITKPLLVAISYTSLLSVWQFVAGKTVGGLFYLLGERTFSLSTPGIALVNLFGKNYLRAYGTFSHPNILAGFSLVSLFIFFEFEKNKHLRWMAIFLCLLNIVLSFSLGAQIALLVCLLIYLLKIETHITHIYKQLILSLVLVSLLLMPLSQKITESGRALPENISNRIKLANIAGEEFSKSPLIGVGLGNFISYIPKSVSLGTVWFLQPVHNIFLLVLSETGAIGLFGFCLLLLSLRVAKNPKRILFILPILITGLFDHYWLTLNQTTFLFALVVGILF